MYRIRFHGRGGQGIKTASRILGSAMFHAGYLVQDAPRYGAERRGAPIFAYVRAAREPINERGIIRSPDLVVVADDSLVAIPSAEVLSGITDTTVLVMISQTSGDEWQRRLNLTCPILTIPTPEKSPKNPWGALCVGAAAGLLGVIDKQDVAAGIEDELGGFGNALVRENLALATKAFESMAQYGITVTEGGPLDVEHHRTTDWVDLGIELQNLSAPAIHGELTSVMVRTGLWRTLRPIIDYEHCNKCNWVCSNYCPDNAITVRDDGYPEIDLNHCKGCMICVSQCPPHAIGTLVEQEAQQLEAAS